MACQQGFGAVLALPAQTDHTEHTPEESLDSVMSPARSTPPYSPGSYPDAIELEEMRTPSPEYDMWGTFLGVSTHEHTRTITPPMIPYTPNMPSSSYGPPPQITDLHLLRLATNIKNDIRKVANDVHRLNHDAEELVQVIQDRINANAPGTSAPSDI